VPTTQVIKPIRGKRMRLTRLDECGTPVVGPASTLVSKGFISLGLSPQYEDGETITQANAQGDFDINEPADPWLTRVDVEGAFIGVHPDVVEMLTGNPVVLDGTGSAVGISSSTRENPSWGVGPYSVVLTGVAPGTPGPLIAPIGARDHWHLQRTAIAPPAVTVGTVALPPP
jgi:hypothetical protein